MPSKNCYHRALYCDKNFESESPCLCDYRFEAVKRQTHKECLEAIIRDPHSFRFIRTKTSELLLEAVKRNFWVLNDFGVPHQLVTPEICLVAYNHPDNKDDKYIPGLLIDNGFQDAWNELLKTHPELHVE